MSCCGGSTGGGERFPGTGCCGSSCAGGRSGCLASEPRIRSCMCQENVGCLDRADCGGFRPRGTAATGACPGPCQCAEEEAWNCNSPPKPNCEWLSNFSELRRQWSDHGRKNSCKCCSCAPTRRAAPCRPCLRPPKPCISSIKTCTFDERLSGGACGGSYENDQQNYPGTSTASPCQPCTPSAKPILKPRSCCQCIDNYCMCQPMPRNCNCPPPPQVDARAERECSCECPSSPECACPPSERKFPKTKVRCPNAKMCCPTPRPQPGPKCNCTKCQPCLPPPCDPCTSTKCRPATVKIQPCPPDPCSPCSTCPRPSSPPCAPSRPRTPSRSSCMAPCRRPGQSFPPVYSHSCHFFPHEIERQVVESGKRGQMMMNKSQQCQCGDDARGCADECQFCCSLNCADDSPTNKRNDIIEHQCNCSYDVHGCANDCQHCCAFECASDVHNNHTRKRISAGSEGKSPSHRYSNEMGIIENIDVDEPTECNMNTQHSRDLQLRDLQTSLTSVPATPKRTTRLLQSLMRGKIIKDSYPSSSRQYVTWHPVGHEIAEQYHQDTTSLFAWMGNFISSIGHSTLVPSPLTLISFTLMILVAVTLSLGSTFYEGYYRSKKVCSRCR